MNDLHDLLQYQFMLGGLVMGCFVTALFFLRFCETRDRLFAMFAVAFLLLGTNWLLLAFTEQDEINTWYYAVRLVAFVLILFAIIDKNREGRRRQA